MSVILFSRLVKELSSPMTLTLLDKKCSVALFQGKFVVVKSFERWRPVTIVAPSLHIVRLALLYTNAMF